MIKQLSAGARVKVWGTATVVEGDPALQARLLVPEQDGVAERAIVIRVTVSRSPSHTMPYPNQATAARFVPSTQAVAAGTMIRNGTAKPWLERYVEPARCTS